MDSYDLRIIGPNGNEVFNLYSVNVDRTETADLITDTADDLANKIIGIDLEIQRREFTITVKAGSWIQDSDYPNSFEYSVNSKGYDEELFRALNDYAITEGATTLEWDKSRDTPEEYKGRITEITSNISQNAVNREPNEFELTITFQATDTDFI